MKLIVFLVAVVAAIIPLSIAVVVLSLVGVLGYALLGTPGAVVLVIVAVVFISAALSTK